MMYTQRQGRTWVSERASSRSTQICIAGLLRRVACCVAAQRGARRPDRCPGAELAPPARPAAGETYGSGETGGCLLLPVGFVRALVFSSFQYCNGPDESIHYMTYCTISCGCRRRRTHPLVWADHNSTSRCGNLVELYSIQGGSWMKHHVCRTCSGGRWAYGVSSFVSLPDRDEPPSYSWGEATNTSCTGRRHSPPHFQRLCTRP